MNYEVKLNTKAIKQVRKFDSADPYKYPFLSGKYSGLRRVAFSTPAGEFRAVYTIREDRKRVIVLFVGPRENFYKELQRYLG